MFLYDYEITRLLSEVIKAMTKMARMTSTIFFNWRYGWPKELQAKSKLNKITRPQN